MGTNVIQEFLENSSIRKTREIELTIQENAALFQGIAFIKLGKALFYFYVLLLVASTLWPKTEAF